MVSMIISFSTAMSLISLSSLSPGHFPQNWNDCPSDLSRSVLRRKSCGIGTLMHVASSVMCFVRPEFRPSCRLTMNLYRV